MKHLLSITLFLLIFSVLTGCNDSPNQEDNNTSDSTETKSISFEHIAFDEAPEDLRMTINVKAREETTFRLPIDDRLYIVVTRGEKPTGGYSVTITDIVQKGDKMIVHYTYRDPGQDEMVTQNVTYPKDIVAIDKTQKKLYFQLDEHINKNE